MPSIKNQRGQVREPIIVQELKFADVTSLRVWLDNLAEENHVPVEITKDYVSSGTLFGKEYPCLVLKHPNPPQRYFEQVILINENILNFYFFGESKATIRKDTMAWQVESLWHQQLCNLYEMLFGETSNE